MYMYYPTLSFMNILFQISFESISNIRTVVALGLEEKFSNKYTESLLVPYK